MRSFAIVCMAVTALGIAACDKTGTCEYKFEEASRDKSIAAGLEVCQPKWEERVCNGNAMASMTLGLKTSGYKFSKGATCEEKGFKDCTRTGTSYYKTCPAK